MPEGMSPAVAIVSLVPAMVTSSSPTLPYLILPGAQEIGSMTIPV